MAIKNVRSELPNRLEQRSFRLTLESLDEQFERRLILPYNPESVQVQVAPGWTPAGGTGAERDRMLWSGNAPMTYSWTHVLQAKNIAVQRGGQYVIDQNNYSRVEGIIATLQGWAQTVQRSTQRPTRLMLTMGQTRQVEGVISSFGYRTMRIGPDGYLLAVEYDITFSESEE